MSDIIDLKSGLSEFYKWYKDNSNQIVLKPFIKNIDENLKQ